MKKLSLFVLLGAGLSLNALDSHAQSFGDFLKNAASDAARQAVGSNVRQAVGNAVDSAAMSVTQPGAAQASAVDAGASAAQAAPAPAAAPVASAGPALVPGCRRSKGTPLDIGARPESFHPASLWPENTCPVYVFGDLEFKQARAAKTAFREASKIPCNDCEGGYWFDAWGGRQLIKGGDYSKEFPKLLVSLAQGQSVGWKGHRYHVSITNTGSHPLGAVPCKQFHYTLKEKGKLVAEYEGMYCEYTRPYISKPEWNEVV